MSNTNSWTNKEKKPISNLNLSSGIGMKYT
jgi:hypothetical protein